MVLCQIPDVIQRKIQFTMHLIILGNQSDYRFEELSRLQAHYIFILKYMISRSRCLFASTSVDDFGQHGSMAF